MTGDELTTRLSIHIMQMAPHQKERMGGRLLIQAAERIHQLEGAIKSHRDQKADDRCWLDDDELYSVLNDGKDSNRQVGDKDAMLANCRRFIERRCEGGAWPSYQDLETALREVAKVDLTDLKAVLSMKDQAQRVLAWRER